ncbi:hypothetical protein PPYR_10071 [Photinus pyralis]|uniref:Uncharacterized protein n=1 Tax=Photinus pyralis TaxID=7054 RepID=A0A5N4AF98_PHOPY|nr:hypothetical protein PPYR_10071 [Photinus pyralis]
MLGDESVHMARGGGDPDTSVNEEQERQNRRLGSEGVMMTVEDIIQATIRTLELYVITDIDGYQNTQIPYEGIVDSSRLRHYSLNLRKELDCDIDDRFEIEYESD